MSYTPVNTFDILIILAKFSSLEILNQNNTNGIKSTINRAEHSGQGNIALYLTWLGVELEENNERCRKITLATWLEAGYLEDAQYWAVAANEVKSLKILN